MIGVIHGRTDQIVHPGIEHEEPAPLWPFMDVNDFGDENPSIGRDHPSRLKSQLHIKPLGHLGDHGGEGVRRGRGGLIEIGNAQSAAEV